MSTTQLTCEDKIKEELQDRQDQLAALYDAIDGDDVEASDAAMEEIREMAYGIETTSVTRVIWSGGGPADYLDIFHTGGELTRVEYVYQDWYDGARRMVFDNSPAWRYAQEILEMVQC